MKYKNLGYAWNRLHNTYIFHDGHVRLVTDMGVEYGLRLAAPGLPAVRVKLEDLDLTPLRLGYVNYHGFSTYICRTPMRRDWRQGARSSNCVTQHVYGEERGPNGLAELLANSTHCVKGEYPSFLECLDLVEETHNSWAFNRNFSLTDNGEVLFKGTAKVGKFTGDKVKLSNKYDYLIEELRDEILQPQHIEVEL